MEQHVGEVNAACLFPLPAQPSGHHRITQHLVEIFTAVYDLGGFKILRSLIFYSLSSSLATFRLPNRATSLAIVNCNDECNKST